MIRKPTRQGVSRLVAGAAVAAASMFTVGIAIASPANADVTTISAQAAQANYHAGETAKIKVTFAGTAHALKYAVISGVDASAQPTQADGTCSTVEQPAGQAVCSVANTKGAGSDTVRVWDDIDDSGTYNSTTEKAASATVNFTGDPTTLSLQTTGAKTTVNNYKVYVVTAKAADGGPAADTAITVTGTESAPQNYVSLALQADHNSNSPQATASGQNYKATVSDTATTGSDGTATIKIAGNVPGKVNMTASFGQVTPAQASHSIVGTTGNDAVSALSVANANPSGVVGGNVSFTVTATDGATEPSPISGATVNYLVTGGPDKTAANSHPTCPGTTDSNGQVTCTLANSAAAGAGTDNVTFYVNQTVQSTQTDGLDDGEPSALGTAKFVAQPPYDQLLLTCQNAANGGAASSNCTVPTATASTTFTVAVNNKDANGVEQPVSGAPVAISVTNGTATLSPNSSVTTGANGTVTFTATPSTTTSGTTYTVQAKGDTASGPSGVAITKTASVTYADRAAQAPVLTPANQTVATSGTAKVTATVKDQFGDPVSGRKLNFGFNAGSRNASQAANVTTGTAGTADFTYADDPANPNVRTDSVKATDSVTSSVSNYVTVTWVTSTTASTIRTGLESDLDPEDCGTGLTQPPTDTATANGNDYADILCFTVTNASGQALGGQTVNVAVDQGFVNGSNLLTPNLSTQSVQVVTDANGQGVAYVGSRKAGVQTISLTDGAAAGSAKITYSAAAPAKLTLTPASVQLTSGDTQAFTANVVDAYSNVVSGATVHFDQTGPGSIGGTAASSVNTDSNGNAKVTLTTASTDTGQGSVTASAGSSSALSGASTYTVSAPAAPVLTKVTAFVPDRTAGQTSYVGSRAIDQNGNLMANVTLSFTVTGADPATGTAKTNADGVAIFEFAVPHAGSVTGKVTGPGGTPTASASATVAQIPVKTSLALSSPSKGKVTATATVSASRSLTGEIVGFYQYVAGSNGQYEYKAQAKVNSSGKATFNFTGLKSGSKLGYRARVVGNNDLNSPYSSGETVTVK